MAKLGEDWIFIGLGIGAIYLVYKSTAPVTNSLDSVSKVIDSASGAGQSYFGLVDDYWSNLRKLQNKVYNYWFGDSQITPSTPKKPSASSDVLGVAQITSKLQGSSSKSNILSKTSTSYNLLTRPVVATPTSDYQIRQNAVSSITQKNTNFNSIVFQKPVSTMQSTTSSLLLRK